MRKTDGVRKHWMRSIVLGIMILAGNLMIAGQQSRDSALITQPTLSAESDDVLTRALNKALNEVEASRIAINAQNAVIEAQKAQIGAMAREAEAKDLLIKLQNAELDRMRAVKCNEKKFFWGILKTKSCW